MNIYTKDLNLLTIFDVLLQERHVGKTAKRLGLSQPAVSHQMGRLREMFEDPLFVRSPTGIIPTETALALRDSVKECLEAAEKLFTQAPFDPSLAKGSLRIATTDYAEQIILPELLPRLEKLAPSLQVITAPLRGTLPREEMAKGDVDLAIAGFFGEMPSGFHSQVLFQDPFACAVRRDHPKVKKNLTLKQYADLDHLLITLTGDLKGRVDEVLQKSGLSRRVVAGISNFITPCFVVASSDYILTAPKKLIDHLGKYLPLKVLKPPIDMTPISVVQAWHSRTHHEPRQRWVRELIKECCQ